MSCSSPARTCHRRWRCFWTTFPSSCQVWRELWSSTSTAGPLAAACGTSLPPVKKTSPPPSEIFERGVALLGWAWFNRNGCGFQLRVWFCFRVGVVFPRRMDDQLLEVVGLYSSLHVGKIQVSLGEPLRMGQAKQIKVSQPRILPGIPGFWTLVPLTD